MNKEIKLENYAKINQLSEVFVSQKAKSREELYFSNTSKTTSVSKLFSIPNEEFSDDTSPSVAQKFLNEVKSTIWTLQRVVKQKVTLNIHNWSSSAHQELHKTVKDEIFPIVNQVDARVQNFKIQFLKEVAKFVQDFKSLAKEADESLAKHKALEYEIERLLRTVVSQDIMSIVQTPTIVETSDLLTELEPHLFDKVSEQKDTTQGTSVNTKFTKQSILGKPPSFSKSKLYSVTPFPNSKVIPKKCLITANHDECAFKYVNGMNSSKKNQSANVSKSANQKKHKLKIKKSKKLGSEEILASPRPSKPRTCLRWLPTGRIFDLCGKIIASSNTESESDTSVCDNASVSNPQEPKSKGFLNSTSFIDSQNWRDIPRDTPIDRVEVLSQEVSKIISRLKIKISSLKLKDIKSKIKIQDDKHAKGTSKEFPSIQGSKIQDVTRSEATSAMTTP
ncbi:hypothetical protein Tco_1092446 [Tanacetum coccineum]|uniref:Uncharacterized protein n=1 Tax=Tanacetum coccineum TaxID=301880 RepID=A0ABQ5IA01_9ASTR